MTYFNNDVFVIRCRHSGIQFRWGLRRKGMQKAWSAVNQKQIFRLWRHMAIVYVASDLKASASEHDEVTSGETSGGHWPREREREREKDSIVDDVNSNTVYYYFISLYTHDIFVSNCNYVCYHIVVYLFYCCCIKTCILTETYTLTIREL